MYDASKAGKPIAGYVYAAKNPFFGSLVKIGATTKTPYERLKALSGAGVPEPFTLLASVATSEPFTLEKRAHRHFDSMRIYGRKKE